MKNGSKGTGTSKESSEGLTDKSMEESDGNGDETCSIDLGPSALNQTMKIHKKATAFSDLLKLQTEIDAKLKKRNQQTQNEFQ